MTFFIDVSGFQAGLDMKLVEADGCAFVVVKASGFNIGRLYVADEYHTHIDNLIAEGLPKGHYYIIGGGQEWKTPTEQARYFVENLYRFDPERDMLMLDNEGIDSNGYLFDDDEAAEFIAEVVRLTGIAPRQRWHYANARDYRNLAPWPKLEALQVKYWWAAYGNRPTGKVPDHQPDLQGSIPRWDAHQHTSSYQLKGWPGALDGNVTPHTVADIFGGSTPMGLREQAIAFAEKYPRPSMHTAGDPATWDQMCGNLMYRFGKYTTPGWAPRLTGPNAWNVGLASGSLNGLAAAAPVGAIHWWRNRNTTGMPGHVGVDVMGGGHTVFMATYALTDSRGYAIGFNSVAGYSGAKTFMQYMGWSDNYAGAKFAVGSSTAGGGGTIIDNTPKIDPRLKHWRNEDNMYVFWKDEPRKSDSDPFTMYATYADPNGQFRFRVVGGQERAVVNAVNIAIPCDQGTIEGLAAEAGYRYDPSTGLPIMNPLPKVEATIQISDAQVNVWAQKTAAAVLGGLQGEGGVTGATVAQIKQLLIDHVPTEFIAK